MQSVLAGKIIKRYTQEELDSAVAAERSRYESKLTEAISARKVAEDRLSAEVNSRTVLENSIVLANVEKAKMKALESALIKARVEAEKAIEASRIADEARSKAESDLAAAQAEVLRMESIPKIDGMSDIRKSLADLKSRTQIVSQPSRTIAGFDLQVTARDANGHILSLRALPK